KTAYIEAELCRGPNCPVRHIFPIDVVFSVRNKGPRKKWTLREEETFEKRHMSEQMAPADPVNISGVPVKDVWLALQVLMRKQGAHIINPSELGRYWTIIK
ncbi:hypothetical protein AAVH_36721, partial [Aphelenchoides avenae]